MATVVDGRDAIILWALHGYFVPQTRMVKKGVAGKQQTIKFTIRDSQESFFFVGKSAQEVEERLRFLHSNKSAVQPFIYAVADDLTKVEEVYTYFDGIRYKFFSVTRAVDMCYKIMYVFNFEFPIECKMFWSFIDKYFYKMKEASFPKVHILCEHLSNIE